MTFAAWGFASDSTPGGSVTVVFPPGYSVDVQSGNIGKPTTDATGQTTFSSGRLDQPLAFFAYFVADRPGAYFETAHPGPGRRSAARRSRCEPGPTIRPGRSVSVDCSSVACRPWPSGIGLPWIADRPLVVAEAISRSTDRLLRPLRPGQPAGSRSPTTPTPFVVLHEAAHAWFDGSLLGRPLGERGLRLVVRTPGARRRSARTVDGRRL